MSSKLALLPLPPQPRFVKPKREKLWLAAKLKCHWCGCETFLCNDNSWDRATIDHIVPRYRGGTNEDNNLVNACNRCNNRRNYEETNGLAEGALLGIYKTTKSNAERKAMRRDALNNVRVVLTGDDKKAILSGQPLPVVQPSRAKVPAIDIVMGQRDQALKEILFLRKELKQYTATVDTLASELKEWREMSIMKFIRLRLVKILTPK